MIVLEQGLNAYDDGLNGLKIGRFLKRNLKSAGKDISIKNAVKVVKFAAPLALSLVPVVGGTGGSLLNKVIKNKDGTASFVGRAVNKVTKNADGTASFVGRAVNTAERLSKTEVGKFVVRQAAPLVKNAKTALLQGTGELPTDEQIATLAEQKGTSPQEELDEMAKLANTGTPTATITAVKKDNTMLYVGGGVLAAGLLYVVMKK